MTSSTIPGTAAEQAINQRLDVIDRALLDLLPRNERLTLVAQVDARARELVKASEISAAAPGLTICPSAETGLSLAGAWPTSALGAPMMLAPPRLPRSRLAITACVLGIVAVVLLIGIPVSYFVVAMLGEIIGEIAAIVLLAIHIGLVTLGGLAAVAVSIAALIGLKRRSGKLAGHGWAIAGLCIGPLPLLAGAATGLVVGIEMMDLPIFSVQTTVSESHPADPSESIPAGYAAPAAYSPAPAQATYSPVPAGGGAPMPAAPGEWAPLHAPDASLYPSPAAQPPLPPTPNALPPTANAAPVSEPETRPEPPGVPHCE